MQLLIRDDDTCAFTQPEELSRCYSRYWDQLPISLAITPFRIPGKNLGVPQSLFGSEEPLPIGDNAEIVEFLREHMARGRIHAALHGFHHNRSDGLPEYVGGRELHRKTREGKRYLEHVLGCRIITFVPPNNAIGAKGLRAVIDNGLNLINVPSLLSRKMRRQPWRNVSKFAKVQFSRRIRGMRYPRVLHFADHAELGYHSVTPTVTVNKLLQEFQSCLRTDGIFVLATHYHAFERQLQSGGTVGGIVNRLATEALGHKDIQGVGCNDVWDIT